MAYSTVRDRSNYHPPRTKDGAPDRGPINYSADPRSIHVGGNLWVRRRRWRSDRRWQRPGRTHPGFRRSGGPGCDQVLDDDADAETECLVPQWREVAPEGLLDVVLATLLDGHVGGPYRE